MTDAPVSGMVSARPAERADVITPFLLCATVLLTVFSQIDGFPLAGVYAVGWFALLVYCLVRGWTRLRVGGFMAFFVFAIGLTVLLCCVCYFATGESGYLTGHLQLLAKVALVYLTGWALSACLGESKGIKYCFVVYVLAAAAYALWAYVTYVPSLTAWLSSTTYLFSSKNNFGQIAAVAAIIAIVELGETNKQKAVWVLVAVLTLFVTLLSQCRTALLGTAVAGIVALALYRKWKVFPILAVVVVLFLLLVPNAKDYVSHAFFLDKYENAVANTFSSGRLALWAKALAALDGNELMGLGDYYVDSMYINALANLGWIVGGLFIAIWVVRVGCNVVRCARTSARSSGYAGGEDPLDLDRLIVALTAFYMVESLLEGLPPFGPGTCSFMFWLLCGLRDGQMSSASELRQRVDWARDYKPAQRTYRARYAPHVMAEASAHSTEKEGLA